MDREKLTAQIKLNCDISDARAWGYYSICGLLMRLRELYRSERSIMPWEEIPREEMSQWIASKEKIWERLADETPHPIKIDESLYDPFQVNEINESLGSYGLLYGAGHGLFNQPTFFLATLDNKRELYDYHVHYAGREFCRDLSAPAAMLQGRCIFIRLEQLSVLLWEKFQEMKGRRFGGSLREAFSFYGLGGADTSPQEVMRTIGNISSDVADLLLFHEIGEAFEDEYGDTWLSFLSLEKDKWTELHARGIKDLLADTSERGPLRFIIDNKKRSLLNFYVVFLDGIRKELFSEMLDAYQRFSEKGDWSDIEKARGEGYRKAYKLRSGIVSLVNEGRSEAVRSYLEAMKRGAWRENK